MGDILDVLQPDEKVLQTERTDLLVTKDLDIAALRSIFDRPHMMSLRRSNDLCGYRDGDYESPE